MGTLDEKRALILGAGRGIGAATAAEFAVRGAQVRLVARSEAELIALHGKLDGQGHGHHALDLSSADDCAALIDAIASEPPHIVVQNFHARSRLKRLRHIHASDLAESIRANTEALLQLLAAVLPFQREAGFGRWISVSSMAARLGGPGQASYAAVKSAIESIYRTLAVEEHRTGITANIVSPGFIDTPGVRENYPEALRERLAAMNLSGRAGTAEEVAHAIAFLAEPAAAFVTGSNLVVDGGLERGWFLNRSD